MPKARKRKGHVEAVRNRNLLAQLAANKRAAESYPYMLEEEDIGIPEEVGKGRYKIHYIEEPESIGAVIDGHHCHCCDDKIPVTDANGNQSIAKID
jgi:hypothetical protein